MTDRLGAGRIGSPSGAFVGTDLSPWITVSSVADLAPWPPTGGVRTIDAKILLPKMIPMPPGERIVGGENAHFSVIPTRSGGFIFDVDAPGLSGPLVLGGIDIVQLNTGPSAWCAEVSTTLGRLPVIDSVQCVGIRGINYTTIAGQAVVTGGGTVLCEVGVGFTGLIGSVKIDTHGAASLLPGGVHFEVFASATILGSIGSQASGTSVVAGQHVYAIADAATFSPGALFQVSAATVAGDLGALIRQDPGDMSVTDDRLLVSGSVTDNWVAILDASRTDLTSPLIVAYPPFPAAAPTPFPYWTGAGVEIEIVSAAHWKMEKDDPGVGDIYFEYVGEKTDNTQVLTISILADRGSGTGAISLLWERDTNPPTDTWTPVDTTVTPAENTNAFRTQMQAEGDAAFNKGDRVRPATENLKDVTAAQVYSIKLSIRGA